MMNLFHARRPDLNQTFISVSVLIRISFSYLLNLAICITFVLRGKCHFSLVLSALLIIKPNLKHNGMFLYPEISDVHPNDFLKLGLFLINSHNDSIHL